VRTIAVGGAATVAASWAAGKLLQNERVTRPSRKLYDYCVKHRSQRLVRRVEPVTTIGGYTVIGSFSVLVGGILAYERRSWTPLQLLIGGAVAEVYLQKALKRLVKGSKPAQETSVGPPGDYPSGGAARTLITFGLLAHMLAQQWDSPAERTAIWSIMASLTAAQGGSRLYLGRHWPEDVLGGWLFGALILTTLLRAEARVSAHACPP
jgi:membrane-associated phospholipid phosphatase